MKSLLVASCMSGLIAAAPLSAQTPTPQSPSAAPSAPLEPVPGTREPGPNVPPPIERPRPGTPQDPTVPRPPLGAERTLRGGPADAMRAPGEPTTAANHLIDDPPRRGGRISETAPAAPAGSGQSRFQVDLKTCEALDAASRASCRQEMFAARAQGLYRN